MALLAGADNNTNVLANVAARLMGRPTNASTLAAHPSAKAFTPRPSAESESKTFPQSANEPNAAKENVTPAYAPSGSSLPEEDTNTTKANAGPPLLGTADQLAAAREFARLATTGSSKSRPSSRTGRQRLFTKEPERQSSSVSSSPRSSAATQQIAQGSSSRVDTNSNSTAAGFDALHDRPLVNLTAAVAPTPAPSPIASPSRSKSAQSKALNLNERWNGFTATSTKNGNDMPKSINDMKLSHAHPPLAPAFPSKVSAAKPPHLRLKAAALGGLEKKASTTTTTTTQEGAVDAMVIDEPDWKQVDVTANGVKSQFSSDKIHKPKPHAMPETLWETPKLCAPNGVEEFNVLSALKGVKNELAAMSERLTRLEQENFIMQKQLETMTQAEERRKFLGTDNAKVPFALNVDCGGNKFCIVQANAELKIYELVRRIRTKADLVKTANPRITVNDKIIGHGMMLGEVGVSKENAPGVTVTFSYEEA